VDYINIRTPQEEVNRKNSKVWIQMNDNSRAKACRDHFVKTYGGFFQYKNREWVWVSPETEHNGYRLKNVNTGEIVFFTNMKEFGEKWGLSSVKICELLTGKRKTYKGWTANELREVKQTTGQHIKKKAPKKKKVAMTKQVTLQDINTNELIIVNNIKQFAKDHGIFPGNLYKLVNGQGKVVKNFKLYNPLNG
jgi:hypothetical protein